MKKFIIPVIVLIVIFSFTLSGCPVDDPPEPVQKIAFMSDSDGSYDI
jgi:hypothetical protein